MEIIKITDAKVLNTIAENIETSEEGLMFEKIIFNTTMQDNNGRITNHEPINYKKKNDEESIEYRKQGNSLYLYDLHNPDIHEEILNLYTQSIATTPIVSKELAYAYGNRSALLFHLEKYDECIKDCDRALKITNADNLKAKLYIRKIKSLLALDIEITKYISEEVLVELPQLQLTPNKKKKFTKTVNILNSISTVSYKNKTEETKNHKVQLFGRHTEVPCASTAISIKYNDSEGRHIIANRQIEPGEILVVEKNYCQCVDFDYKYLFCSHCTQPTWASIPCEECIYSIYCSEKCKSEAWEKYHKFECSVLSYLYSLHLDKYFYLPSKKTKNSKSIMRIIALALRISLLSVHEFGDITKLEKELTVFAHDFRTEAFLAKGIFDSRTYKSIFNLRNSRSYMNDDSKQLVRIVCVVTYYLAKESTFFGEKISKTPPEMTQNKNITVFGALLLKNVYIILSNFTNLKHFKIKDGVTVSFNHGISISPFCSLFNHSCNPNVISFNTKNNETLIYAQHLIEKGQQLFLCYIDDDFTSLPKSQRIQVLNDSYYFECKCLACEKNWPTSLRFIKDILSCTMELRPMLECKYRNIKKFENHVMSSLQDKKFRYDFIIINDLRRLMTAYAENFTIYSKDYQIFANYMKTMLVDAYGIVQNFTEICCTCH